MDLTKELNRLSIDVNNDRIEHQLRQRHTFSFGTYFKIKRFSFSF